MNALDALYIPLAIATAPWWASKRRSGWAERFGRVAPVSPMTPIVPGGDGPPRRRVLVHAVSVGETNALRQLVPMLLETMDVVISVTTDTGIARARSLFASLPGCAVVRYPLDFSWAVGRFLDAVAPDAIALVELEVWPNFVAAAKARGIPTCIINGRLSERSFRGYNRIRRVFARSLGRLDFVAAQDDAYAARFEALGLHPDRCLITGSMKWDGVRTSADAVALPGADALAADLGIDRARPLIVAGSTAPGEHALLRDAVRTACPPGCQLLCAPRKPEWFDRAAADLPGCVRRSHRNKGGAEVKGENGKGTEGTGQAASSDFYLLDSIGELPAAYSLADVVVVGRSFGDLYGSDPVEPIALGKATLIGPSVADFAGVVDEFLKAGGLVQTSAGDLGADLARLLGSPEERRRLVGAGQACIDRHRGGSRRHAELLRRLAATAPTRRPASRK